MIFDMFCYSILVRFLVPKWSQNGPKLKEKSVEVGWQEVTCIKSKNDEKPLVFVGFCKIRRCEICPKSSQVDIKIDIKIMSSKVVDLDPDFDPKMVPKSVPRGVQNRTKSDMKMSLKKGCIKKALIGVGGPEFPRSGSRQKPLAKAKGRLLNYENRR